MATKNKKVIRDSIKSEAKNFFTEVKKFGHEAEDLVLRGGEKIAHVSQIGKLKGEIMVLYQRKKQRFGELGERLMQSKDKSIIQDASLLEIIKDIEEIELKREVCDEQIENLKKRYQGKK